MNPQTVPPAPAPDPDLVRFYENDARWYSGQLRLEHIMESTPQATQRKISLESFDLVRRARPEVQCFNELLIQYPVAGQRQPGRVVPDNFIVLHPTPLTQALLNLCVHRLQTLIEIGQHMLELFLVFAQGQILHLRITQSISKLAVTLREHLNLCKNHVPLLLALIKFRHEGLSLGFEVDHLPTTLKQTRRTLHLTTRHDSGSIHDFSVQGDENRSVRSAPFLSFPQLQRLVQGPNDHHTIKQGIASRRSSCISLNQIDRSPDHTGLCSDRRPPRGRRSPVPPWTLWDKTASPERLLLEKPNQPFADRRLIHEPSANTLPQHRLDRTFHPGGNDQPLGHRIPHAFTRLEGRPLLLALSTVAHFFTYHTLERLKT